MKHRQHLGTQDKSCQRKTTPNSFTPGKINRTNHYILQQNHVDKVIYTDFFASQKLSYLNHLNTEWVTYYFNIKKHSLKTDEWEWFWQKDKTPDTVIFCEES